MDARSGKTLSVALAIDAAVAWETGRRNDGEWHRGVGERKTSLVALSIELVEAVSN